MKSFTLALLAAALVVVPSSAQAQEAIDGQYIVVLKDDASTASADRAKTRARDRGGRIQRESFGRVLNGFSATLDSKALAAVKADAAVDFVEQDRVVRLNATQANATWGLDRLDQRDLPLSSTYSYDETGAGVKAYIIDTGIRLSHNDFGGRASSGYDAIDGGSADDCNGHGTHVAGTVGGSTYGVAKAVSLVAVRVLDCNGEGSTSGVIGGVNWVTTNHLAGQAAVANMSLGGGVSNALDTAVSNSIADGVTYALAAGNESTNACNSSPARTVAAITVGATTRTDARADSDRDADADHDAHAGHRDAHGHALRHGCFVGPAGRHLLPVDHERHAPGVAHRPGERRLRPRAVQVQRRVVDARRQFRGIDLHGADQLRRHGGLLLLARHVVERQRRVHAELVAPVS